MNSAKYSKQTEKKGSTQLIEVLIFIIFQFKGEKLPTFVTASNSAYFKPLEATVFYIHRFFPDAKLIIYDLGLTDDQYRKVKIALNIQDKLFRLI